MSEEFPFAKSDSTLFNIEIWEQTAPCPHPEWYTDIKFPYKDRICSACGERF